LGPIFVKLGQFLSTRPDLLPEDIIQALSGLQDQVPPFSGAMAQALIEKNLNRPLSAVFSTFDLVPLASASIAQVHAATLLNGQAVVIKVLRPRIQRRIKRDLALLHVFSRCVEFFWRPARIFKPTALCQELKRILLAECDFMREAANASQFKRHLNTSTDIKVPEIYWPYCHKHILVMERVYGISITDHALLREHHINLKILAEKLIRNFFTQAFHHCFFHADMQPGNIFVSCTTPEDPSYAIVDFGIMGSLGIADQRYLAENCMALFKHDYRRIAELHVNSGWLPTETPMDEFESEIRTVCEPILGRPLKEISIGNTLLRLFQTAQRFKINIQPQLILLQKTLLTLEGLSRQLYPDLDLWQTLQPVLEDWLKQQKHPKTLLCKMFNQWINTYL
jgi:ubiquinone biosynthesis protein